MPRNLIRMAQGFDLPFWAIVAQDRAAGRDAGDPRGFRITVSIAIILLVAAEMIGAERGIGAFVLSAGNLYDTDKLLAGDRHAVAARARAVLGDRTAGAGAAGLAIGGRTI